MGLELPDVRAKQSTHSWRRARGDRLGALIALGVLLGTVVTASSASAAPGDVAVLKQQLRGLEETAKLYRAAAEDDSWCTTVSGAAYVGFARDVGVLGDTAAVVFTRKKALLRRVEALRADLAELDTVRGRCAAFDRWELERTLLVERAALDPLAAVDDLRAALDQWRATFGTSSPSGLEATCRRVLEAALTPAWPERWQDVSYADVVRRSRSTRALPECGAAAAGAGRDLYATKVVVGDLRAARELFGEGDIQGARRLLEQRLTMWPDASRYPATAAEELLRQLQRTTRLSLVERIDDCRIAPEGCPFAAIHGALERLRRAEPSREAFVSEQAERIEEVEVEWIRMNRVLLGDSSTLEGVRLHQRWIEAHESQLLSRLGSMGLQVWTDELADRFVGLDKIRSSLIGGTEVVLQGDHLCTLEGEPFGEEWGPRGETKAQLRGLVRDLQSKLSLREPTIALASPKREPGTAPEAAPRCRQTLVLETELTSCAVTALWEPELPRLLDRDFGVVIGAMLRRKLLSTLRAFMPADGYSVRLRNRSGRTLRIELDRTGMDPRQYLDGVHLNPHGTNSVPAEYVDVLRAVLEDVRACP